MREILADSRGVALSGRGDAREADYLKKMGYEKIGCDRLYETMVFAAAPAKASEGCCPWRAADGRDIDFAGYNDPAAAFAGHLTLCAKWDSVPPPAIEAAYV